MGILLQVTALNLTLQTSKSMRTYIKGSGDGPIIEFSNEPSVDGDNGDGAGVPVFATLPLSAFGEAHLKCVVKYSHAGFRI